MNRWQGDTDAYKNTPTWHSESRYFAAERVRQFGFYGLRDIAKGHYDWLKDQPGSTSSKRKCMVAAFWDPNIKTIYASSIPLGPRKVEMIAASYSSGAAPSWYNQVRRFVKSNMNSVPIHAEDGAYYNYETTVAAQAKNGRYPDGSMIAIYGKYANWPNPGPIAPCGADSIFLGSCLRRSLYRLGY